MKFTPHILGAVAVVGIAGAVSGATIGESPVLKRGLTETMPEAPIVRASNAAMQDGKNLPDHYPLKTPDGTIEVAELALHGRMRDRGGELWWDGRDDERLYTDASYERYEIAHVEAIDHERRSITLENQEMARAQGTSETSRKPHAAKRVSRAEAPMPLAEPAEITLEPAGSAAADEDTGSSRMVSVAAAVARRD